MNKIHTITVNGASFRVQDPEAARVDDTAISNQNVWSAKQVVDALCPAFSKSGSMVTCRPVAGYPLTVQAASGATKVLRNGEEFAVGALIPALAGENVLRADEGEITVTGRADPLYLLESIMERG